MAGNKVGKAPSPAAILAYPSRPKPSDASCKPALSLLLEVLVNNLNVLAGYALLLTCGLVAAPLLRPSGGAPRRAPPREAQPGRPARRLGRAAADPLQARGKRQRSGSASCGWRLEDNDESDGE
jgi:hypothetical protein